MEYMNPKELLSFLEKNLREAIIDSRIETRKAGVKQKEFHNVWLQVKRENFTEAVKVLASIDYPHIAIIAGNDTGESVDLTYLFSIYYGARFKEISVNIKVSLDHKNPTINSITDIIPGAQTTERELKEMFGVKFIGLPDMHNIFLPYDFPKDVFPFRKDQKGLDKLVQKES